MANWLFILLLAYLIGAIPFGFILYWIYEKRDIREIGSGNIGATNITRAMGIFKGILILLVDVLKGMAAVYLTSQWMPDIRWAGLAGLAAIVGHMFPVYLGFRGGKGVATWIGAFILIAPSKVCFALMAFLLVFLITRYVSLGSMTAVVCFPIILLAAGSDLCLWLPATAAAALIVNKHRDNIRRILKKTEHRFSYGKKKVKKGAQPWKT